MAIHPTAVVDPAASIHPTATIGPYAVIGPHVEIGEGCEIMASAYVDNTRMGRFNTIHPHAVLGGDPQSLGFDKKIRSWVRLGDNNTVRELAQIHRGLTEGSETTVGSGCFLMATAHVAHDCAIGNEVVITNGALVAGHVTVGDRAFISGPSGIHQYCRIGRLAMIGGMSGVSRDVPPFCTVRGDIAFLIGINVVGLRRAGVGTAARTAVKQAFRMLFRAGKSLPEALRQVRVQYEGRTDMPAEVEELLAFCETKSKRGILTTTRTGRLAPATGLSEDSGDE